MVCYFFFFISFSLFLLFVLIIFVILAANEKRREREAIEQKYEEFRGMLSSDEWLNGLETQIRSKKERNVKSYVRGIYTSIDKDWNGPKPNYVEGLGPII